MIPFPKSLKFSAIALIGVTFGAHGAQAPQRIDVKQMSKKVENVVVPLPNEIFGALNKLGSVNWREFVRTEKTSNFTERPGSREDSALALTAEANRCLFIMSRR